LKHQLKTDIRGVNVWAYAPVTLDESGQLLIQTALVGERAVVVKRRE